MSGAGRPDRPGTPTSPGAWDARSLRWLDEPEPRPGDDDPGAPHDTAPAHTAPAHTDSDRGAPAAAVAVGAAGAVTAVRRGAADPVKALMHRHRELCERAVDPLEIAAGLEAHGVTDRTAARFRHRDVFSLAEEMYARVARDGEEPPRPEPAAEPGAGIGRALLGLLPGALCAAALTGLRLTAGRTRPVVAAAGVLAVALALRAALRRGPLSTPRRTGASAPGGPHTPGTRAWTCWLVAYALLGDGLLAVALEGGPDGLPDGTAGGPWPMTAAPLLALTLACAPALWTARIFAARARRKLSASRGLEEFATSVRPLLLGTFGLFLCSLAALLAASGAALRESAGYAQALTLGALLLLARLLAAHGVTRAPAAALAVAATVEATALATVFAARLPGCDVLAVPVRSLVTALGPGSIPALACGAVAVGLLVHATHALTRASAHAGAEGRP
ncbi:hypothetical protein ABZT08_11330 [Streptomyces sp. NPDC005526]|uniref:hypothetical protein n=1 Tax=Streptomyces sp. NPDC005526 TaxID=3156885 RepID=UPI00339E1484